MTLSVFINNIQQHLNAKKPFVVYKMPNTSQWVAQLQNSTLMVNENFEEEGFLFAPFTSKKHPSIWFPTQDATLLKIDYDFDSQYSESSSNVGNDLSSKSKHIAIVEKAISFLQAQKLQKVVLSRKEVISTNFEKPLDHFKQMCKRYSSAFCYLWFHPNIGMWLGATPETLIKLNQNKFETMALAGTMPLVFNEKVTWGVKEKEEQQLVVDSILHELKGVTKNIEVGLTITQKAGSLLHLKTPIYGELLQASSINILIKLLHPTPAVCGLPKPQAQRFIIENEGYDRKYYTGFLGVINPQGNSSLFVNLRCMEVEAKSVNIYVGGGITALSEAEKEWQETVNKSQIMKQIL